MRPPTNKYKYDMSPTNMTWSHLQIWHEPCYKYDMNPPTNMTWSLLQIWHICRRAQTQSYLNFVFDRESKMAATGRLSLTLDPMGISFKDLFVRNYSTNWIFLNYLNVPWMVLYLIYYFGADRKSPRPIMYSDWVKLWRSF